MMRFGHSKWSARLAALVLFVLPSLAAAGWSNPLRPPSENMDPEQLRAGTEYMGRIYAQNHKADGAREYIQIDLADEAQYRFVMDRLQASGKNSVNAPYLFRRLEDARRRALARAAGSPQPVAATADSWECDHFLLLKDGYLDPTNQVPYNTGPSVTCTGGANYVYADVVAWSTNATQSEKTALTSGSREEYEGGKDFHVPVTAKMPPQNTRRLLVDSMTIAMNDVTGQEFVTYLQALTTPGTQPLLTSYSVAPQRALPEVQTLDPSMGVPGHPRYAPSSPVDGSIVSCQIRGGTDCDYAVVGDNGTLFPFPSVATGIAMRATVTPSWTGDRTNYFKFSDYNITFAWDHVYVPAQFGFDAGAAPGDCLIRTVSPGSVVRLLKTDGGTCSSSTTTSIKADIEASVGKRVAPVKRLLDFSATTGGNCTLNRIQNSVVAFVPTVIVEADCGNGPIPRRFTGRSDQQWAWSLQILNSCLAEGTGVLRADGSRAPVESLRVGDKLLANSRGLTLTITDVAHGGEMKPLVHLKDDKGHDVKVTEDHPFILASGKVVKAVGVKVKDRVRTREGVASIVSTGRVAYEGKVYNVTLGTPEELARVSPRERTLYANGFLVGDNAMQAELDRPAPQKADVLASLPRAWHQDFKRRPGGR